MEPERQRFIYKFIDESGTGSFFDTYAVRPKTVVRDSAWEKLADQAAADGEHPAFVAAIRCSGLFVPKSEEVESITVYAGILSFDAFGSSADWFNAVFHWVMEHPEGYPAAHFRFLQLLERWMNAVRGARLSLHQT